MCGIFGILSKNLSEDELVEAAGWVNDAQSCRGPDDKGVWHVARGGGRVAFGHTRLSILDLTDAGHQPMALQGREIRNPNIENRNNDEIVITYNGEIYNFKELREELKKEGYEFKTETDTEVILAGYDAWGIDVVQKLRGMFAFGLWDGAQGKLYLAKDRYGIKPLYYYKSEDGLVFGSTVKGFLESELVPDKREERAWMGLFLFGSVPAPWTTIKDVWALPAGHYLEIDVETAEMEKVQYYDPLSFFLNKKTMDNPRLAVHETRRLLEESTEKHLISDAPLGVFLSGGLDSSAVAALATEARGDSDKLKTLSIIFDEKEFSEERYSDAVAKRIGSDHKKIKITKEYFLNNLEDAFKAMDQPTIDGINTYFIAKAAKEAGLKVVLSGLGGDEIFLGYSHFKKASFLRRVQSLPKVLKLPLILGDFVGGKWAKLSCLVKNDPLHFYLAVRGVFSPRQVAKVLGVELKEVNEFIGSLSEHYGLDSVRLQEFHPADLLSYLELKFYLQNQLLKDSDFMGMHHSVEIRVPFLDHSLVEYVSSLPVGIKMSPKFIRPKSLLISAMRDDLPKEVWDRNKMGFTFPFKKWLRESKLPTTNYQLPTKNHWSRTWAKVVMERFK